MPAAAAIYSSIESAKLTVSSATSSIRIASGLLAEDDSTGSRRLKPARFCARINLPVPSESQGMAAYGASFPFPLAPAGVG